MLLDVVDVTAHLLKQWTGAVLPVLRSDRLRLVAQRVDQERVGLLGRRQAGAELVDRWRHDTARFVREAQLPVVEPERFPQELPVELVRYGVVVLPPRYPGLQRLPARQSHAAAHC